MPRQPRLDAPGLLQHVIGRGIERRSIYNDEYDKQFYVKRLSGLLMETGTSMYAWCLMDNHFHLLLKTADVSLGKFMNRLLCSYGLYFNKRHNRVGHLFQNRYKSIVCQEDVYLLSLVRYIHLNPLRAKMFQSVNDLESYPFSGHQALIGKVESKWQATDDILNLFAKTKKSARRAYLNFLADVDEDMGVYPRRDFSGNQAIFDQRILGDDDFTKTLIGDNELPLRQKITDPKTLTELVAGLFNISSAMMKTSSKSREIANARSAAAFAAQKIGMKGSLIAKELGVTEACISRSAQRGTRFLNERPHLKDQLMKMLIC